MPTRTAGRVATDTDIIRARQAGRELAAEVGFVGVDLVVVATAISEVARNIVRYATSGDLEIAPLHQGHRHGIEIVARDQGPGIADIELAMQDGYSTGSGLGMGLPGCKRLMDEFEVASSPAGTTVTMRKWVT
jgi:serine/threonine-protein kinase RsbT